MATFRTRCFHNKGISTIQGDFLLTYNGELIDEEEGCKRETHYPAEAGSFLFFFNHKGKNLW